MDEPVRTLVTPAVVVEAGTALGEDLDALFKNDAELECVLVATSGRPTHLITREHYYIKTGGRYGFTLYQKRPVEAVAKPHPLVVDGTATVLQLAQLALDRTRESQYDPVIVTGSTGQIQGIVTIRQVIAKAAELRLQTAQLANPLTGLPGMPMVQSWIESGLGEPEEAGAEDLTVLFVDLDHFKQFNDVYGLVAGDGLLRCTARVLAESLAAMPPGTRLGHGGADDFVIVAPGRVSGDALRALCHRFDRERLALFDPSDLARGFFYARDDKGNLHRVPLVTLRLIAVGSAALGPQRHPASFSQAAARFRRTAKTLTAALQRSCFVACDGSGEEAA